MRRKNKPFILFELLVALFITSLVVVPLFRYPFLRVSKQIDELFEIELENHAECLFAQIKSELYANTIPWEIINGKNRGKAFKTENKILFLPNGVSRKVEQKIYLKSNEKKKKTGKDGEDCILLTVEIGFEIQENRKKRENARIYRKSVDFFVMRKNEKAPEKKA